MINNDVAISVCNLRKRYVLGDGGGYKSLRSSLTAALRRPLANGGSAKKNGRGSFWALDDVNFEVRRGEVVGIIGRNGAGKSTLLKIISRITKPTAGHVELRGRVGSLLEVGTGFHPELTGRENIYLNGAILGMTRGEIRDKFDAIVDFSEIEKFLDTPVKQYSSGMYTRLAFSVAAHLEPEILIVDEVLAVGDASFQNKCLGKMKDVAGQGRTVLFVSHNMVAVQNLCTTVHELAGGKRINGGEAGEAVRAYLTRTGVGADDGVVPLAERRDRSGDGSARLLDAWLEERNGERAAYAICGDPLRLCIKYEGCGKPESLHFTVRVYDEQETCLLNLSTRLCPPDAVPSSASGVAMCELDRLPLLAGRYQLAFGIYRRDALADLVTNAMPLTVEAGDFFGTGAMPPPHLCKVLLPHSWSTRP